MDKKHKVLSSHEINGNDISLSSLTCIFQGLANQGLAMSKVYAKCSHSGKEVVCGYKLLKNEETGETIVLLMTESADKHHKANEAEGH